MIDKFFDYDSIEINGGLIMPRILATALGSDIKKVINKTEKIARKVFGENGILPMPKGAVEIIPDPVSSVSLKEQIIINVLLHEKEDRTPEKLDKIAKEFEKIAKTVTTVNINPSPKELWRLI